MITSGGRPLAFPSELLEALLVLRMVFSRKGDSLDCILARVNVVEDTPGTARLSRRLDLVQFPWTLPGLLL